MLSATDFSKKQIVFVFFNEGEKMAFSNCNFVIKRKDGSVKFQCTCYRLFIVFAVGHCSITSALLQQAKKYGFFIALMTQGFRLYELIGAEKNGNTLLHEKQYKYEGMALAKHIVENKLANQIYMLRKIRQKNDFQKEAITSIDTYICKVSQTESLGELLAYEGLAAKLYFKNYFDNVKWNGRQPRIKRDYVNSSLDIGYTLLFTFVDALLSSFGFDTYRGVLHTQFYMRKSLVCDLIEPFRVLIDQAVKKGINLKQIQANDFLEINHQYKLKWEESSRYTKIFMNPLVENKDLIFVFVQSYYRAFMKGLPADSFPSFDMED